MNHRNIQLIKKFISECKDIIRYTSKIGERSLTLEIHGCGELRMELVWNLSQEEVPALMKQFEDLLKEV